MNFWVSTLSFPSGFGTRDLQVYLKRGASCSVEDGRLLDNRLVVLVASLD